jgi:hypothetical protein
MTSPPITPANTTRATAPMANTVPVSDPALLAFSTWPWLGLLVPLIELSLGAEPLEEPDLFELPDEFEWLGCESPLLPAPAAGAGVIPTPKRGAAWFPDEPDEPEEPDDPEDPEDAEPDCPDPPPPAFRPWSTGVEYCFAAGLPGLAVTPSCEPDPL